MSDEKLTRSKSENEIKPKVESEKIDEKDTETAIPKKTLWVQMRILPIYVRVLLVTLLLVGVMVIGLRIGYSIIGDGDPGDIFKKETWLHMIDIINGKE